MNVQGCGNCRYAAPPDCYGVVRCRRFPPLSGSQPVVQPDMWCAEWSPTAAMVYFREPFPEAPVPASLAVPEEDQA